MKPHSEKDVTTDTKVANKITRKLNEHSKQFVKILNIGEGNGQSKRAVSNATVSQDGEIPTLMGAFKDQLDIKEGIKMRPIVNAMAGPKRPLSDMFSDVVEKVLDISNDENWCRSTEELLSSIEILNSKIKAVYETKTDVNTKIIGSMDAISLFPSIKANRAAEIVVSEVIASDVNFDGLNIKELSRYLRKNLSNKEIDDKGLGEVIPSKKKKKENNLPEEKTKLPDNSNEMTMY